MSADDLEARTAKHRETAKAELARRIGRPLDARDWTERMTPFTEAFLTTYVKLLLLDDEIEAARGRMRASGLTDRVIDMQLAADRFGSPQS